MCLFVGRRVATNCLCKSAAYSLITAQKIKFFIKDFLSKCDQIRRELRIWSHLLNKSLMENFIFCPVNFTLTQRFIDIFQHRKYI